MRLKEYSGQDASQDMANCLFLLISDLGVFYRHAESCQFVAFFNSYFYRRILLTRGELPICGIHNQSNIFFFLLSGMTTTLKNSIMVQSNRLLHEILNDATIFEKQILFLAASSFGIPDPLFGLYYVYIYHQVFI
jgi:hypothetical protein